MAAAELVFVYAVLKPADGKKDEVEAGMKELATNVEQNEPGCLSYNFFYSPNENTFLVVERYQNMAALEAHRASEHFARALKEGMEGKLAAHPTIHIVQPCGGFTRQ